MTRNTTAVLGGVRARVGLAKATATMVALLMVLSACSQPAAQPSKSQPSKSQAEESQASGTPKVNPPAQLGSSNPKPKNGAKSLKGGGFASAVPGSDAPDRKDDTGPVIPLSADAPDIKEIERLVRDVEKIAKQLAAAQPVPAGSTVAEAVGTFSYRYFADGSVEPDPAWVAANIRTETVPILGHVTGHRVVLPQLRGALQEIVDRGLAAEIHPAEYAGCYVPRFIASDPSRGLSLHTWGIAVDLNVPGNRRGTTGEIDRTVVAIFKKWGFAWGGDWKYTDPMHFELAALVEAR